MVFYVIVFSALAVLLVIAGMTQRSRNRRKLDGDSASGRPDAHRRTRAEQRTQSRNARRKRR